MLLTIASPLSRLAIVLSSSERILGCAFHDGSSLRDHFVSKNDLCVHVGEDHRGNHTRELRDRFAIMTYLHN